MICCIIRIAKFLPKVGFFGWEVACKKILVNQLTFKKGLSLVSKCCLCMLCEGRLIHFGKACFLWQIPVPPLGYLGCFLSQ